MVRFPETLMDPVLETNTPPMPLLSASPVNVKLEPTPVVVTAPITLKNRLTAKATELVKLIAM